MVLGMCNTGGRFENIDHVQSSREIVMGGPLSSWLGFYSIIHLTHGIRLILAIDYTPYMIYDSARHHNLHRFLASDSLSCTYYYLQHQYTI